MIKQKECEECGEKLSVLEILAGLELCQECKEVVECGGYFKITDILDL